VIAWDGEALRAMAAEVGWKVADRQRPHFLYRAFDAEGQLLYIGRTWEPWRRFSSHGQSPWRPFAARVEWEFVGDYEAAKQAEAHAIRSEHPIHNVRHREQVPA
jgi:hypothetical protein